MNKTAVVTIVSVLVLLILGSIIYYANTPSTNSVVINSDTDTTTQTSQPVARVAGAPLVNTLSKVASTDTTVVLTGQVTPNGAPTNYWYEYGRTANLGSKSTTQMLGSGYVKFNTPAYITGLSKNAQYYFRLVAENQFEKVAGDQYSFKTTDGVSSPIGGTPLIKTLAVTNVSRNTANLNGEVNPNQASTDYWFEYGKTANLGETSAIISVGSGDTKLNESALISGLDALTTYYFRVNAQNQFGTVNGSVLNFKTSGPVTTAVPKVINLKATSVSDTDATLHASVNPNGAETIYWFEYSTDSQFGSVSLKKTDEVTLGANTNITSVKEDISNLAKDTTYYFRVVAKNSVGTVYVDSLSFKTNKK